LVGLKVDVAIVGGAVSGGALANALGSRGVSTLLIEKVSREVHSTRGDLLHPPTLRLLDHWGVLEALHADGTLRITELAVSHRDRGLLARFPLRATDDGPAGRTIAIPHDRIEAVLYACAARWPSVRTLRGVVTRTVRDSRGRVQGVRVRVAADEQEVEILSRVVAACDGAMSGIRRSVGIKAEAEAYAHEQVIIACDGESELPAALHWYLDDIGALTIVSRPRAQCRMLLTLPLGVRGDLLKEPDPALHDYVADRFPMLSHLGIERTHAHVYRLGRHVAESFWSPGVALVGDAAHATHPAGASGMSLAITGAARLAESVAPALLSGATDADIDDALESYDAERRPSAMMAVEANHQQALRIWQSDLFRDPDAYVEAINPNSGWGAGNAGWGQDPAAAKNVSLPAGPLDAGHPGAPA
jgi:2-polyprenyl-6-methoxyphenol hydroxylase-like FAD-dependent oxidoreductase